MNIDTIKYFLAILVTIATVGILYALLFIPIPALSRDALLLALGSVLSRMGDAYGYYFGSSAGSARKTELLSPSN